MTPEIKLDLTQMSPLEKRLLCSIIEEEEKLK